MIRSMTGYGSAEIERDGQRLTAEIRSVNHRFCEVSIRAPKGVAAFEDQIRQLIQDRFSRGKLNLSITWSGAGDSGEVLRLNEPVTDRYVALLEQLRKRYGLDGGIDVKTLAALPDVFAWEHTALSDEETWGARARRWRTTSRCGSQSCASSPTPSASARRCGRSRCATA